MKSNDHEEDSGVKPVDKEAAESTESAEAEESTAAEELAEAEQSAEAEVQAEAEQSAEAEVLAEAEELDEMVDSFADAEELAEAEEPSSVEDYHLPSPGRLPFAFSSRHGVVITDAFHDEVRVSLRGDISAQALAETRRFAGRPVKFTVVGEGDFDQQLSAAYESDSSEAMQMVEGLGDELDLASLAEQIPETEDLLEQADDAPIIRLINAVLSEAVKVSASDVHIETFETRLSIRFRVDGVLREMVQPKRELAPLLVSRIKVMAKLDIAEKRVPQDGRISLRVGGRGIDLRVSTLPNSAGERVVMRLLDKQAGRLQVKSLGMSDGELERLIDTIEKPHGVFLVTGPTGSGKTTSLYAALTHLNSPVRNILTAEDPIEYQLDGIGQCQVNAKVDMTFGKSLKAMLRQDPDVVMVGEIRDVETAEIAVQASLTGHLVLSTLHTNTAIGALARLQDMGVEPFLLATSLVGVLAQRLVRVLCDDCKDPYTPDDRECEMFDLDKDNRPTLYHAVGCDHCNGQGYSKRKGIYELVVVDEKIRTLIHERASEIDITKYARTKGPGIREDGLRNILAGWTTVEEVVRVTKED